MAQKSKNSTAEVVNADYYTLINEIDYDSIRPVISWILAANYASPQPKELTLLICSNGGETPAAFALVDIMQTSKIPIKTIGMGEVASAGLLIFLAGTSGRRFLTKNTSILSHQFTWTIEGKHHELSGDIRESNLINDRMISLYEQATGLNRKVITKKLLTPTNVWLTPDEAKMYGFCNGICDSRL